MNISEPASACRRAPSGGLLRRLPARECRRFRIPEIGRRGGLRIAIRCRRPYGRIHYSAGRRGEAMDTDVRSIRNCLVDLSAQFGQLRIAYPVAWSCFIGSDSRRYATNGLVRQHHRMGADCIDRAIRPVRQKPGLFPTGPLRFSDRRVGHAIAAISTYDRPRHATTVTPAIASRPPHAVAMPGRSPVSAIDSSVATAGVR